MATVTTTRSGFYTWPDEFCAELFPDFSLVRDACFGKPSPLLARRTRSIGLPSPSRREPKRETRKAKSVHFADSKGLALVSVLTFNVERELQEEFTNLSLNSLARKTINKAKTGHARPTTKESLKGKPRQRLTVPPDKLAKRVASHKVCMEKIELLDSEIRGTVCVHNLAYEKRVAARYTLDQWRNQNDIFATFHSGSAGKDIDRFVFEISVPNESPPKNYKVEFAVHYTVLGETFWDNNNGFNYHVLFSRAG